MSSNEKITMRQLQVLIILSAMGTGAIVLPRRAAEFLPVQNGWVIAVGLALLAIGIGVLISVAARAVQTACVGQGRFLEAASFLLTRPVAYGVCFALWLKIVIAAGFELRIFLELSRDVMLPNTPLSVVGGVMILACVYAAGKGIETRARVAEVLFALVSVPVMILFVVALFDVDFSNVRPLHIGDASAALRGVLRLGFIFTGLECLLLVAPFVPRDKNMARSVASALAFAGLIIVALTTVTIASLGPGAATEPWPVVRLMDAISIPGAFIERQEALMFGFWIITSFALGSAMLYFGGLLIRDFLPSAHSDRMRKIGVALTAAAVFGTSLLPFSSDEIFRQMDYMYMTSGIFFLIVLPVALIIAAKITELGRHKVLAKMAAFLILAAFAAMFLVGCWDKVEIEDRAFVVAVGIDARDGEYVVTLSVPIFSDEEENEDAHIKTAQARTVSEALQELCEKDERQLFFGQTQMVIFANDLMEDPELLRGAVDALNKTLQATQRVHVLRADSATEVLAKTPPEKIIPYYEDSIMSYYDFEKSVRVVSLPAPI